ncbi:protein stum homolog [Liolophura sinensis]|uniref:protein stum homolog n=1 Tax=Liolophura sinensis TaxID=3198878 RepID=UPI003157F8BF
MATLDAPENANTALTGAKKRSVQIDDHPKTEIVEIHEKHGPLHNAIPRMPIPAAVICCILNIFLPGMGTLISSFTVFCGSSTRISTPCKACWLNILAAFLQMITFFIIVGWIWSILWGMTFVQLSLRASEDKSDFPYYVRRQSSVEVGHG